MKILVVTSYNTGHITPFVAEQVESLRKRSIDIDYYKIIGKGALGYLKNYRKLKAKIEANNYDLVHAHYGLSGLLANMQRKIPVITTYHGSDIHCKRNRLLSFLCSRLSVFNILTNKDQIDLLKLNNNYSVIPCGINCELFRPLPKAECRKKMGYQENDKLILFSSSFDRKIKNYPLAKKAIELVLVSDNVQLIELKGYTKEEVSLLVNASELVLITSFNETGPLIAKEALACNTPVVSTDVGDVKELIQDLDRCYITTYEPDDVARKIEWVLKSNKKCAGRKRVEKCDLQNVAKQINGVYQKYIKNH